MNAENKRLKILAVLPFPKEGMAQLMDKHDVFYPSKTLSKEEVLRLLPEYDILAAAFIRYISPEIIDSGKNLKLIANYGVGFNNIDVEYASSKGIIVTNAPQPVIVPTANLAMGLLLDITRGISRTDRLLRDGGGFSTLSKTFGTAIEGKTLGIVGMGRIGRAMAERAKLFGLKIAYYNRNRLLQEIEEKYDATYLSLDELLTTSDIVSIHTPLSEATHHLIGEKELAFMKPTAYIINTSRGPVIDEKALVSALQKQKLAGAGLDVFEFEPEISSELLEMDNVVLTPHIGTSTVDDRINLCKCMCDNIIAFGNEEFNRMDIVNRTELGY